mgnify:CR=1 FL=1
MAKYFRSGDAAALSILFMNEICPDQEEGRNCDLCGREAKDLCDLISRVQAAAEMAEGKIGPDVKPHCWHITDEWILAIENAISSCVLIERYTGQDLQHETAVLRTMLREG